MVEHFDLKPGDRVLDVGCCQGISGQGLLKVCPGLEAFGLDISEYALMQCEPEVIGRLHLGNAIELPFPDNSFKAVISLNTIHNLDRAALHHRAARDRAPGAGPRIRPGQFVPHAGGKGDIPGVGADGKDPRLSGRLGQAVRARPATPAIITGPSSSNAGFGRSARQYRVEGFRGRASGTKDG